MKTSYYIKQTSPGFFITTFLTIFILGIIFTSFLENQYSFSSRGLLSSFIYFALIMISALYLTKLTAIAEIKIVIDDTGIKRIWLNQFILHNRPDKQYKWSDIESYIFEPDRLFDQFKIHLKNGTKFRFYHNNNHDNKDDFQKFLSDFIQKVEMLNNTEENKQEYITLGKTIYETTWGLILAFVAIIAIIGLPIILFTAPHKFSKSNSFVSFSVIYSGAIYYIFQVYFHRKKREKHEDYSK